MSWIIFWICYFGSLFLLLVAYNLGLSEDICTFIAGVITGIGICNIVIIYYKGK